MDFLALTELSAKWTCAAGGFLGGTSLMAYTKPASIGQALVRMGVSTAAASMLSPLVMQKIFGSDADLQMLGGVAFAIGFVAWNVLGAVALFFERRKNLDAKELIKGVTDGS